MVQLLVANMFSSRFLKLPYEVPNRFPTSCLKKCIFQACLGEGGSLQMFDAMKKSILLGYGRTKIDVAYSQNESWGSALGITTTTEADFCFCLFLKIALFLWKSAMSSPMSFVLFVQRYYFVNDYTWLQDLAKKKPFFLFLNCFWMVEIHCMVLGTEQ